MKNVLLKSILFFLIVAAVSCSSDDEVLRNNESIIPSEFLNRDNVVLGEIQLTNREITISIWDHGQIDGDIVSIYVNGEILIAERTLDGPFNKFEVQTTLDFNGYNYLLLFAHNEGSISPNTASISIYDGASTREFILESNLQTNGTVDLIID